MLTVKIRVRHIRIDGSPEKPVFIPVIPKATLMQLAPMFRVIVAGAFSNLSDKTVSPEDVLIEYLECSSLLIGPDMVVSLESNEDFGAAVRTTLCQRVAIRILELPGATSRISTICVQHKTQDIAGVVADINPDTGLARINNSWSK